MRHVLGVKTDSVASESKEWKRFSILKCQCELTKYLRTNPVSGWKSIFPVGGHVSHINDVSELESKVGFIFTFYSLYFRKTNGRIGAAQVVFQAIS